MTTWAALWLTGAVLAQLEPVLGAGTAAQPTLPQVALALARLIPVWLLMLGVAVAASATRSTTTAVAMPVTLLVAPLPLAKVDELEFLLPQCWIADWLGLPGAGQFFTYFWPRDNDVSAYSGALVVGTGALALCAAALLQHLVPPAAGED